MERKEVENEITYKDLKNGDLLFSSHPYCNLSQAIDLVTQTGEGTHFSHVGILEVTADAFNVYHASPKNGVYCELLEQFVHPDDEENTVVVYRLKEEYARYIDKAIHLAKGLLGEQYNYSFRISAPGYYCSEFIHKIFAPWKIFELIPMTFKHPEDRTFSSHWIEYYKHLNVSIPERQPGCNPNKMAASEKLQIIGQLKF